MKAIIRDVLIEIGIAIALITGGCAQFEHWWEAKYHQNNRSDRYDSQGNGTSLKAKAERGLVYEVNHEHY